MTNVDLPVEPTLLDEAIYYQRRGIALWLATHHPEACRGIQSRYDAYPAKVPCGYDATMVEWLQTHEIVRPFVHWETKVYKQLRDGDDKEEGTFIARYPPPSARAE